MDPFLSEGTSSEGEAEDGGGQGSFPSSLQSVSHVNCLEFIFPDRNLP